MKRKEVNPYILNKKVRHTEDHTLDEGYILISVHKEKTVSKTASFYLRAETECSFSDLASDKYMYLVVI